VTLQRLALLPLASALPEPSHLRLQYALAGGGVYVSGPTGAPPHVTPLSGDASAAWSGGPALLAGAGPAAADTEWPSPGGTTQRTNVAFHPGFGVFAKAHAVLGIGRHVSLRIVPKDQDYWLSRAPSLFVNTDQRGRRFATLGAGTGAGDTSAACDGSQRLISDYNRFNDVHDPPQVLDRLRFTRAAENGIIEQILEADHNYGDALPYCFFPAAVEETYNSNSFVSGLLRAINVRRPTTPGIFLFQYPGWAKPVPASEFRPRVP
jgi:hypothetical protein